MLLVAMICGIILAGKHMDNVHLSNIDDEVPVNTVNDYEKTLSKEHK
jgi:hypothetical protein